MGFHVAVTSKLVFRPVVMSAFSTVALPKTDPFIPTWTLTNGTLAVYAVGLVTLTNACKVIESWEVSTTLIDPILGSAAPNAPLGKARDMHVSR